MNRIVVLGLSGSGKTTVSRTLGEILGLEVHAFDLIRWGPDWTGADPEELASQVEQLCARPTWIIDGCSDAAMAKVIGEADTIIWLDFNLLLCATRMVKRNLTLHRRGEWPVKTKLHRDSFISHFKGQNMVVRFFAHRSYYRKAVRLARSGTRIIRLRSDRETRAWLRGMES